MVQLQDIKSIKDLNDWIKETYDPYDGPPRAYFEYDTSEGKCRVNYLVLAIGQKSKNPGDIDQEGILQAMAASMLLTFSPKKQLWVRRGMDFQFEWETNLTLGADGFYNTYNTGFYLAKLTGRFGQFGVDSSPALKLEGAPVVCKEV